MTTPDTINLTTASVRIMARNARRGNTSPSDVTHIRGVGATTLTYDEKDKTYQLTVDGVVKEPITNADGVYQALAAEYEELASDDVTDDEAAPEASDGDDGTEVEDDADDAEEADEPELAQGFNRKEIRPSLKPLTIQALAKRLKRSRINVSPDYQRKDVWKLRQQRELVESLIWGLYVPPICVVETDDKWEVIDGRQRLTAIDAFVNGDLKLRGLNILQHLNNQSYETLSEGDKDALDDAVIHVAVFPDGTPTEVIVEAFMRLNTGGTKLNKRECRWAASMGPCQALVHELANSDEFKGATANSIKPDRMKDYDMVVRALAFYMEGLKGPDGQVLLPTYNGRLHQYQLMAMKVINGMDDKGRAILRDGFTNAMTAASRIWGDKAFRKITDPDADRIPQISLSLFEIITVLLMDLDDASIEDLASRSDELIKELARELTENDDFIDATSRATTTTQAVATRYNVLADLLGIELEEAPAEG